MRILGIEQHSEHIIPFFLFDKCLCLGNDLGVIADMCGFKSCDDMRRTFRQFEGDSLSSWRRVAKGKNEA